LTIGHGPAGGGRTSDGGDPMRSPLARDEQTPGGPREGAGRRQLPTAPRSWGTVTVGVLIVAVAGLVGALAFAQAGETISVLAVNSPVAQGETIDRGDLGSQQVAGVDHAVPVEKVGSVVGKTATVDLPAGHVVTTDAVT